MLSLLLVSSAVAVPLAGVSLTLDAAYDYVVVGGGTGGLAIANRLSADGKTSVAVVEAGTYYELTDPFIASTPAGDVLFAGSDPSDTNPLVDWSFVTVPQQGAADRRIRYPRWKTLGGSSALNFMAYHKAERSSLDRWADLTGDDSYRFDNFDKYFRRSVQFHEPDTSKRAANASVRFNSADFDTSGGPLQISYANYASPFSSYIEASLNEIGLPTSPSFNNGQLSGVGYCSSTINPASESRESSQTSFLNAASNRPNLNVYELTTARKILFDGQKRATGVLTDKGFTLSARKEVIVSAGAFQSPQLLMVSGVGPKDTLNKFNIPVIADRPGVGQGMQDHCFWSTTYRVKVDTLTRLANDPVYAAEQIARYGEGRGVFTNPVLDVLAWEKVNRSVIDAATAAKLDQLAPGGWPEIEYLSAPGYVGDFGNLLLDQPHDGYQYASILAAVVAPASRGTVTLASASTADLPIIDPRWLTDPVDAAVAVASYKRLRQAFASKAMSAVLADSTEYHPGPSVATDEQILAQIRKDVHTVYHASCTNRMGKADDLTAVVDSSARVYGVSKLRVVDASSFAVLPPGHPQSVVYALAEKIADSIISGH
ncbi:hypothetical protein PYCC9005_001731 [Savitreella phatthalungensis]